MIGSGKPRVLSVDDEPRVLQAIRRSLVFRGSVDIQTAIGPEEGLKQIEESEPFAVVISDLRMPNMDGLAFLSRVSEMAPNTVRILLTGEQDFDSAVKAVNAGYVFRFLTKPCATPVLLQAVDDAVEQHRLIIAERVLLEETLYGCVRTLTELLALVSPEAFARANRIRENVLRLRESLGLAVDWQLDIAAMLSQIGCVTLPPETAARLYHGESLANAETDMVERLPSVAVKLLGNIPRLEEVRRIVKYQNNKFDEKSEIPLGSRLLKVAVDFDLLMSAIHDVQLAIATMQEREGWYDPTVLDALHTMHGDNALEERLEQVCLTGLRPGMILAEDVKTLTGLLVMGRGQEITNGVQERLGNLALRMSVVEPIRVRVRTGAGSRMQASRAT